MSEAPKRLSKVAKEFNVGISTIVEFLSSKGRDIESNPNTKIDQEVYSLLIQEYMPDKAEKEKSQELKKQKVVRQTITLDDQVKDESFENDEYSDSDTDEVLIKNVAPSSPIVIDTKSSIEKESEIEKKVTKEEKAPVEDNLISKEESTIESEEPQKKIDKTPEIIKSENNSDMGKLQVLGKIDLGKLNQKTRPDKKKRQEPSKPEPQKENKVENKKSSDSKTVSPAKSSTEETKKTVDKAPIINRPTIEEKVAPKAQESKDTPPIHLEPEHINTKVEKLEGLTVIGKINLPVEQPKGKKKSPIASSSDDEAGKRKKKRKRISTKPNEGSPQTPQQGGGGNKPQNKGGNKDFGKGKPNTKRPEKAEVSEEAIQKEIKETLARLSGGTGKSKGSKFRKEKRQAYAQQREEELAQQEADKKTLRVTEFVTANELATMMDVSVNEVISACMSLGMMVSINQRLDAETLSLVADEFGYEIDFVKSDIEDTNEVEVVDSEEDLSPRPAIITVMGHVDHGKTSLLDYVRKANVIAGEAGGITQHIGAYSVRLEDGRQLTFLDTPGHEAFTAMRARGAQVTDLVIIVIAADDSVMPQTKEAINHAQAAGVPIVFAYNKIDKPTANPDKIREQLSAMGILVEEWGGKYQTQEISAKSGLGVNELLEKVLLEADILELKANPKRRAEGTIIEASLDKGRGYVATLLVQTGTLRVGDVIVAGSHFAKVKALFDERGNRVKEAGPSQPASMLGFNGAPSAGDKFKEYEDEREAKAIASKREQLQREQGIRTKRHITLDEIGRRLALGDFQELNIIVKGDVDGSVEALSDSLLKLSTENIQVNIIHKSVGQISESDVLLASASDAIVVGFQVRPSAGARKLAEQEEIQIRLYSIIYKAIEEIKDAMEGMLKSKFEEKIVCNIEVRETFKITKVGTIAGCYVLDGKINRNTKIRLIRDGIVMYSGELGSLKRFKDDVKEVAAGYECGLNIHNYNDIKEGDIIEGYEEVEIKQTL